MEDTQNIIHFWDGTYAAMEAYTGDAKMGNDYFDGKLAALAARGHVLDFGCGAGWASLCLALSGCARVTGIDASEKAVKLCTESAALSGVAEKTAFLCGDATLLGTAAARDFDGCFCANTLDVVPETVCDEMVRGIAASLRAGGMFVLTLNAYVDADRLEKLGMEKVGERSYAKDGVLRCVNRTADEWKALLSPYFTCAEYGTFRFPGEPDWYDRRLFVLIKK